MPILRSKHQAELLTWLFLHPDTEYAFGELAAQLAVSPSTLHDEVQRLTKAGIISARNVGRTRLLSANTDSRLARSLTDLLTLSFGPQVVIGEEFEALEDANQVIIYGSWAERYAGIEGAEPGDVDVMVIGRPDRDQVYAAADRAQLRLGIPVNPTVRSSAAWSAKTDALVTSIQASSYVTVVEHGGAAA